MTHTASDRVGDRFGRWVARFAATLILAALGWLVSYGMWPTVGSNSYGARREKALSDLQAIYGSALRAQTDRGTWPTLDDLRTPDESGNAFLEMEPLDPWESEYRLPAATPDSPARALSAGPDRRFGTADDLVFPSREQ